MAYEVNHPTRPGTKDSTKPAPTEHFSLVPKRAPKAPRHDFQKLPKDRRKGINHYVCQSRFKLNNSLICPSFPRLDVVNMSMRKNKRATEGIVEIDSEETSFILEPAQIEVGSGYTVAVSYDEEDRPIVDVKTYGQVDIAQLRRSIERTFPNAQIRHLNRSESATLVKTKTKHKNKEK